MTDYASFKRGGRSYPLPLAVSGSLLLRADPFLFYALEYYKRVLEVHLGAALLEAASGTAITSTVAYTSPVDPAPWLTQGQYKFPLLAVYRKRGKLEDRSANWRVTSGQFEVLYILPPLTPADAEKIVPILNAAADVIDDRTFQGVDPLYTPTSGTAGQSPWEMANCAKVTITDAEWGLFDGFDDELFFGLKLTGTVIERAEFVSTDYETFAGTNIDVDQKQQDGSNIVSVVEANTQQDPTVSSVLPTSGSYAGGVALTITGTLFKAPATVWVAGARAENVVVVNATTITCTTSAAHPRTIGATGDVEVETDFGSDTLEDAFTFTA